MIPSMLVQTCVAAVNAFVSFLLMLFLARAFGAERFGSYVALLGVALIGLAAIEGGWPALVYRSTALDERRGRERLGNAVAHALGAGSLLVAAAWALGRGEASAGLPVALACMTAVALMNLVSARLRGLGRFALEAAWQAAGRLASAGAIVAVVFAVGAGVGAVFAAWLAAAAMALTAGARWLAPARRSGLAAGYAEALPLAAIEAGVVVLTRSETTVLGALGASAAPLSAYAACTRINEAALLLAAAASNVVVRWLARDEAPARTVLPRLVAGAFAAGAVFLLLAGAFGRGLMEMLFGPGFATAGVLLPWVAASLPFALPNLLLLQVLLARRQDRRLLVLVAAGAVLHLVATASGYAVAGMRGAAVGAASAQMAVFALFLRAALASRSAA